MKIKRRVHAICLTAILASVAVLYYGCGSKGGNIPNGSTITITPSSVSLTNPYAYGDVIQDYTVVVAASNGTPIPYAGIRISGSFAAPVLSSEGTYSTPLYEFWSAPGANGGSGVPEPNGFVAETNSFGIYNFSILIYSTVTITAGEPQPNQFTDTIDVMSGSALGSSTIAVTVQSSQ